MDFQNKFENINSQRQKPGSFIITGKGKKKQQWLTILFSLFLLFMVSGAGISNVYATPVVVIDDAGVNDEPGQKDLTLLSIDFSPANLHDIDIMWQWDETSLSGNNTGDACSLYDTGADGLVDFAVCVIWGGNGVYETTRLYSCGNSASDKCTQTRTLIAEDTDTDGDLEAISGGPYATTCDPFASATGVDPFVGGDDFPVDVKATCHVNLTDFNSSTGNTSLINVCSYPSQVPGSDPSDCIFTPNSGTLTIVKVGPGSGNTTQFTFNLGAGQQAINGSSSFGIQGSGSETLISFVPGSYDLTEIIPTGWQLDSASCVSGGGNSTGTFDNTDTVDNFSIVAGLTTTCTFTNSLQPSSLTVAKAITSDNGGTATLDDFNVSVDSTEVAWTTPSSTSGGSEQVTTTAGTYTLSEGTVAGYTNGTWSCSDTNGVVAVTNSGASGGANVTVATGQAVSCTITNDDIAVPIMTIAKTVMLQGGTCGVNDVESQAINAPTQDVTYCYVLSNTGNASLSGITLSDNILGTVTCPATTLAVGASMTCTANKDVTQPEVDAGTSIVNTGTADSTQTTAVTDTATLTFTQTPALTIVKAASPTTYNAVNDVISYSYLVTNSGNVTVSQPITIADDKSTDESCPATPVSLAPGDTITCTASYTITQADLDAGTATNIASATGKDSGGANITSPTDTETVTATQAPALVLTKAASPTLVTAAGEDITYTFSVENTGNQTLTGITISDPLLTGLSCTPIATLAVGATASATCTGNAYTVQQSDIDNNGGGDGDIDNTATATGSSPGNTDDVSDTDSRFVTLPDRIPPNLSLELTKTANPTSVNAVNDVITYTFSVRNIGNTTLSNITVSDPLLTGLSCNTIATLAPGATENVTCTDNTYTVQQSDIDNNGIDASGTADGDGDIDNTATATGSSPGNTDDVSDTDSQAVTLPALAPALVLTKTASPTSVNAVNDVITYTFSVENTGNTTLTNISVTDPLLSSLSCTPIAALAVGATASVTCTGNTYNVQQSDIDNNGIDGNGAADGDGDIDNTATATGSSPGNTGDVSNTDSKAVSLPVLAPALVLTKTASATTAAVGDVLTYTFSVENTGNTTLSNVSVTDPLLTGLSCNTIASLTVGASESFTCTGNTYTVQQSDINNNGGGDGDIDNTATTTGSSPGNTDDISDTASQAVILSLATLTLQKNVINDDNGTASDSDWILQAAGTSVTIQGIETDASVIAANVTPGVYTLTESGGPSGYQLTGWNCTAGTLVGNQVTLALGETATCIATNDDDEPLPVSPATLTLQKTVINDNGGTANDSDWTLIATGPDTISGIEAAPAVTAASVAPGVYTLSESGGPSAYQLTGWSCTGGTLVGIQLTLVADETAVCTATNNDVEPLPAAAPILTLEKTVINDDAGSSIDTDWTLYAAGPIVIFGSEGEATITAASVPAGTYILTESGSPTGYTLKGWVCTAGTLNGNLLTLAPDETTVCTATNDDVEQANIPTLSEWMLILLSLLLLLTGRHASIKYRRPMKQV